MIARGLPVAAVCLGVLLGGCSSGGDGDASSKKTTTQRKAPKQDSSEAQTIRAWVTANNTGQYEDAARYFARGAIVQQTVTTKLRTREAAIAFNASLPCRATVTDIEDEGATVVAAFRLRQGRTGQCKGGGTARVRFRFKGGKFIEWRQLPGGAAPGGQIA
jgi:Tfp pilus assembly protein FimT